MARARGLGPGDARGRRAEPLLFAAWYRELSRLIYADELGELFPRFWGVRPQFMDADPDRAPDLVRRRRRPRRSRPAPSSRPRRSSWRSPTSPRRFGADPAAGAGARRTRRAWRTPLFGDQPLLAWLFNIEHRERRRQHHGQRRPLLAARRAPTRSPAPMPRAIAGCTTSPTSTARASSPAPASPAIRCRRTIAI